MYLFANLSGIRNHISVLQEEQEAANELLKSLNFWSGQAVITGIPNAERIWNHIQVINNEIQNIQRRVTLLDSIANKFADTQLWVDKILSADTMESDSRIV